MGHWRTGGAAIGTLCLLGTAIEPALGQIKTTPPPPVMTLAAPPLETTPPPWAVPAAPTGNPAEWVTTNDYPTKALREEAQGTVAFRLEIGSDGLVRDCTITNSSGSQELDEATCSLVMRRARFTPARNTQDHAVASSYSNRVRWVLSTNYGSGAIVKLAELTRIVTFFVETDGTVTQCTMVINGVNQSASEYNDCVKRREYAPFHDASGNAVRRKVTMTSTVTITDPDAKLAPRKRRRK